MTQPHLVDKNDQTTTGKWTAESQRWAAAKLEVFVGFVPEKRFCPSWVTFP